ncbi:unnamed protein product [Blepharisma stoltei]|uniref:C2H2-type domain-containing protein n=1 Tax=Blepharisma stoltei TaxID=1481888 RepID=A0AAU9IWS8_9CILI|nr:unnamed protein product [Blepharisma stoltei]
MDEGYFSPYKKKLFNKKFNSMKLHPYFSKYTIQDDIPGTKRYGKKSQSLFNSKLEIKPEISNLYSGIPYRKLFKTNAKKIVGSSLSSPSQKHIKSYSNKNIRHIKIQDVYDFLDNNNDFKTDRKQNRYIFDEKTSCLRCAFQFDTPAHKRDHPSLENIIERADFNSPSSLSSIRCWNIKNYH